MSDITVDQMNEVLSDALTAPKEVENDAGSVKTQDLDKLVDALEYARKVTSSSLDPFKCLKQAKIRYRDAW